MDEKFLNIVLYNPQIPPNTGNIIRLCSNTSSKLHLIKPFGFDLNTKSLRRAGLDYEANYQTYENFSEFIESQDKKTKRFFVSKFGEKIYSDQRFNHGDSLIFGSETNGLPESLIESYKYPRLFIPMRQKCRSINLSNAVAICVYEALRQNHFFNLDRYKE